VQPPFSGAPLPRHPTDFPAQKTSHVHTSLGRKMFMTLMAWHAMVIAPPCTLHAHVPPFPTAPGPSKVRPQRAFNSFGAAFSRNALFIFNHRTNTSQAPLLARPSLTPQKYAVQQAKIWPIICSTICANNWRIKAKSGK